MLHIHKEIKLEQIVYEPHIVAFLDILAFGNLIREAESPEQARRIIFQFEQALKHEALGEISPADNLGSTRMFSDCICIAARPTPAGFDWVFWRCVVIQGLLIEQGYLLRGAITKGRHYQSEKLIFSEGLVASFYLERNDPYPRIIVENAVAEQATEMVNHGMPWSPAKDLLLKDEDGKIFLDYFRYLELLSFNQAFRPDSTQSFDTSHTSQESLMPSEFVGRHKALADNGAVKYRNNSGIHSKYHWMQEYHARKDRYNANFK